MSNITVVEAVRVINAELNYQVTSKLEKIKMGIISRVLVAINTALTEKVIPELQGNIGALNSALNAQLDLKSTGLHSNPERTLTCKNTSKQVS